MIKTEHPYTDMYGNVKENLVRTYTDQEDKVLQQVETSLIYGDSVVDVYPSKYHYIEIDKPVDPEPEEPDIEPEENE